MRSKYEAPLQHLLQRARNQPNEYGGALRVAATALEVLTSNTPLFKSYDLLLRCEEQVINLLKKFEGEKQQPQPQPDTQPAKPAPVAQPQPPLASPVSAPPPPPQQPPPAPPAQKQPLLPLPPPPALAAAMTKPAATVTPTAPAAPQQPPPQKPSPPLAVKSTAVPAVHPPLPLGAVAAQQQLPSPPPPPLAASAPAPVSVKLEAGASPPNSSAFMSVTTPSVVLTKPAPSALAAAPPAFKPPAPTPKLIPPVEAKPAAAQIIRSLDAVPRNEDGSIRVPFEVGGGLTIHNLGRVVWDRDSWHTPKYIATAGFKSSRLCPSLSNPKQLCRYYTEILDEGRVRQIMLFGTVVIDHLMTFTIGSAKVCSNSK